ncbi:phage tail protein [Paenibacillus albicereus]|uniref:Phage tail protein n=1 Tax=Paenibacillus albicereus TaxID=2726185 RepID=A0A6H2GYP4_9BACL|nr:tail fiber protein [Paenibacillus albicereus]QJC52512.1 phage tail protein [Paenibacillus albicereus]
MSDQYVGEIRIFAGHYAPQGWAFCDGQALSIAGNELLFALIGTTYGGDGVQTFSLPDLRGRLPVHAGRSAAGTSYVLGQMAGAESVTLTAAQLPAHTHTVQANGSASDGDDPAGAFWGASDALKPYGAGAPTAFMAAGAVSAVGGGQAHGNMMPYLAFNFIIALQGQYPPQD